MRRVAETSVHAPTHTRAGAFLPMSWAGAKPYVAFAATCYLLSPYLGLSSFDVSPRIAEVWPPGGVGFVLVTTVWFLGRRVIGATLGFMFVVFTVTAVLLGRDVDASLWLGPVGVGQPLLMTWLYRRRLNHTGWAPENQHDVAALLFATVSS